MIPRCPFQVLYLPCGPLEDGIGLLSAAWVRPGDWPVWRSQATIVYRGEFDRRAFLDAPIALVALLTRVAQEWEAVHAGG